jgi:hypothetical protein
VKWSAFAHTTFWFSVPAGVRLGSSSSQAVGLDRDRHGRSTGLRAERLDQPPVGQQGRVDPACEIAQVLERCLRLGLDLPEQLAGLRRVPIGERPGETRLHRQRHELLLGAVVDVALELLGPVVLGRDDAPP